MPKVVTQRAEDILSELESEHGKIIPKAAVAKAEAKAPAEEPMMASLFASSLSDSLLALDVMTMTPLEAMNELYKLQEQAKKEAGRA